MDFHNAMAISATGMDVEKMRLDISAVNLANIHSTAGPNGKLFRPLHVTVSEAGANFAVGFERLAGVPLHGARVLSIEETDVAPHRAYDPGNPDADDKGFVSTPGINQVTEMVNIASALRAYEANVVAMNAAKHMAMKALEIGGSQ
jgi:flagellar basal-body rod protein FlgC